MKTIRDIMRPSFLFRVPRSASVLEAVHVMAANNIGIVAVLDGDALVGVLSERDVVRRVVDRGLDPAATKVEDAMTAELILGDIDEDYRMAMLKMDRANIRHLPVISGGQVVSMLSVRDLMRAELFEAGIELEYLRAYLYQAPPDADGRRALL
jgi:CBS domain-containing protein